MVAINIHIKANNLGVSVLAVLKWVRSEDHGLDANNCLREKRVCGCLQNDYRLPSLPLQTSL